MAECDHADLARVKVRFMFTPRVAGGQEGQFAAECAPLRLELFGTRELSCRQPQQLLLRSTNLDARRVVEVEFFVHQHSRASGRLALPFCDADAGEHSEYAEDESGGVCARSAAVIANLYARTWTENGQRIWTSLGGALMPLATLLNMQRSHQVHRTFQVVLDREIDAPAQPATPPTKGVIEVLNVEIDRRVALRTRRAGDIYHSVESLEAARAAMAAMVQRGQGCFFGTGAYLRPTVPALLPFHVPNNQTDFLLLPSSSYTMVRPRAPPNVPYYEQLVRIALRRSQLSEAEALELARGTRSNTATRADRAAFSALVVRAMCVFALSQCYMDDITNLNDGTGAYRADLVCNDEDFKLCRLCGGDDCEGCALEPHMHVNQLSARLDDATLAQMSPLLREVRSFLRTFVPCLTLGCVTNKQLTIDRLDASNSMAHTFAVLVPFRLFERMLAPTDRAAVVTRSRFAAERRADVDAWRGIDQCPLICEGTAPIDPVMRPTGAYYDGDPAAGAVAEKAVVERRAFAEFAIGCLKSTQTANRIGLEISGATALGASALDQSTFYKYIVSFTTNAFVDQMRCDFSLVYQRDAPAARTFGVRFADFINGKPEVGLVPYLVYTKQEAAIVDAVLTDQQPVPNLVLPADNQAAAGALARLEALALRKARRGGDGERGTLAHTRHVYATARLIDIDESAVRAIEAIASGALVLSFEYKLYTLSAAVDGTDDHNWIVDFYFTF
mgnify:CR=1 FL=1